MLIIGWLLLVGEVGEDRMHSWSKLMSKLNQWLNLGLHFRWWNNSNWQNAPWNNLFPGQSNHLIFLLIYWFAAFQLRFQIYPHQLELLQLKSSKGQLFSFFIFTATLKLLWISFIFMVPNIICLLIISNFISSA